ncbi:MAG: hypothetical protein QXZ17_00240 [Nitrososphaerota archaeon]
MARRNTSRGNGGNEWVHLASIIWILGFLSLIGVVLNLGRTTSIILIVAGLIIHIGAYVGTR